MNYKIISTSFYVKLHITFVTNGQLKITPSLVLSFSLRVRLRMYNRSKIPSYNMKVTLMTLNNKMLLLYKILSEIIVIIETNFCLMTKNLYFLYTS